MAVSSVRKMASTSVNSSQPASRIDRRVASRVVKSRRHILDFMLQLDAEIFQFFMAQH
jgi:hypothetical protein